MKRGRAKKIRSEEAELIRFGISIPGDLLHKFDAHLSQHKNLNRSEAIRDLIKDRLVQSEWQDGRGEQLATVTLVYTSKDPDCPRRLVDAKRALGARLLSSTQVRVSDSQVLDVLVLRGVATTIRSDAESLVSTKGLSHGKLVMTTPVA